MLPCKQHLIAIYVIFVEESIDLRLVWQDIGKKMSSHGAALTVSYMPNILEYAVCW